MADILDIRRSEKFLQFVGTLVSKRAVQPSHLKICENSKDDSVPLNERTSRNTFNRSTHTRLCVNDKVLQVVEVDSGTNHIVSCQQNRRISIEEVNIKRKPYIAG